MLQTLTIILVVLSVLFSIFLFTVKTKNKLGNILLGSYFLIMAIDFSAYLDYDIPMLLLMLRNDISSMSARPLIFLYVLSVLYSDFKLQKKHLLHALWLIATLLLMTPIYIADQETQVHFFSNYLDYPQGVILMPLSMIHTQFYLILVFVSLIRYRKKILQYFSNASLKNYKWLMQMTIFLQILFL